MNRNGTKRSLALLLACGLLCLLPIAALAEVEITEMEIRESLDDLIAAYYYPAFTSEDEALAEALDASITQPAKARYDDLYAQYEEFKGDRTDEVQAEYDADVSFVDEISGSYEILSNDDAYIQIITPVSFRPAAGNGDWERTYSYVFSVEEMRLLTLADLFEDDAETVYSELNRAVEEGLPSIPDVYEDAEAAVTEETPFYLTPAEKGIHLLFNAYELSPSSLEIIIDMNTLLLTPAGEEAPAEEDMAAGVPNPMREATEEEIEGALGVVMAVPMGAEDIAYFLYDTEPVIGEVQFSMDNAAYTYRAQPSLTLEDASGMFVTFAEEEAVPMGEGEATLKLNEGAEGVCLWYDAEAGMSYSVSLSDGATADGLTEMANTLAGLS